MPASDDTISMMPDLFTGTTQNDDPRKLRTLLARVTDLARAHSVASVMVGLAACEGDLRFPDFVDYLESALRVEDGIFHMTRERIVVHLADIDRGGAQDVMERLLSGFDAEYPSAGPPPFEVRYCEVKPGGDDLSVRNVLKAVFSSDPDPSLH